jgi:hypothetical protein
VGRYGEPPEDPLLLFSVLYAAAIPGYIAFNGGLALELAAQFLALAEKQKAIVPRVMRQQTRNWMCNWMDWSGWRRKKARCSGKRSQWYFGAAYWP